MKWGLSEKVKKNLEESEQSAADCSLHPPLRASPSQPVEFLNLMLRDTFKCRRMLDLTNLSRFFTIIHISHWQELFTSLLCHRESDSQRFVFVFIQSNKHGKTKENMFFKWDMLILKIRDCSVLVKYLIQDDTCPPSEKVNTSLV